MSEATEGRRARAGKGTRAAGGGSRASRSFVVAAQGENVVLVDSSTGRSWALASDAGHPVWQPIAFRAPAEKAPKGVGKDDEE